MNNFFLDTLNSKLNGKFASYEEINLLKNKIKFTPEWYCNLISKAPIIGTEIEIQDKDDLTKIGIEIRWMSPEESISELIDAYPGINVAKFNLLPFGICLMGSGNPYFIDTKIEKNSIIRVIHDEFDEYDNYIQEVVINDFEEFLKLAYKI